MAAFNVRVIDARRDPAALEKLASIAQAGIPDHVLRQTAEIIDAVRQRGDDALVELTRKYDWPNATADKLAIPESELEAAYSAVDQAWLRSLRRARDNLWAFQQRCLPRTWLDEFSGMLLGQLIRPISTVGIYAPGKAAPLPSTVLHTAVPALVAGVGEIIMATPPLPDGSVDPHMLVAAAECSVSQVFRIGGAQAIAAMAIGTATVPKVDKIAGPGNIYVTAAKKLLFGEVGIDCLAGPSEAIIIADASANPDFVAIDLLSQAEHSGDNLVALITDSEALAGRVEDRIRRLLDKLDRSQLIRASLERCGAVVLVRSLQQAADIANALAPEHLQLMVEDPWGIVSEILSAGAIFIGPYSPVPLGDYAAGPSHVLPTGRAARFSSGLSAADFVKSISLIWASRRAAAELAEHIQRLAHSEGLGAHARSAAERSNNPGGPESAS